MAPKRTEQHELEDISRAKFKVCLTRGWIFRDKQQMNSELTDEEMENIDKIIEEIKQSPPKPKPPDAP